MLMRAAKPATAKIRPVPTDFPEYVAEVEKHTRLREELEEVTRRHAAIIETFPMGPDGIRMPTTLGGRNAMSVRAMDLLAGGAGSRDLVAGDMQELDALYDRRELLKVAVKIQGEAVRQVKKEVGRRIAIQLMPEYREAVHRIVAALPALKAASDAEREIVEHLMAHDITVVFPVVTVASWLTQYSPFSRVVQESYGLELRP